MFVRVKKTGNYSYVQIVENHREGTAVKQRVVATLGQYEELSSSGKLDDLARSFLKHTTAVRVVDAQREGSIRARQTRKLGPALVFDRLWHELGIATVLEELLEAKRFRFPAERAIFLTVLHRLFDPGSDRSAEQWKEEYLIEERLFTRNRDFFSELEIVFFDTTSLYFEGSGGESLGQYGHSKDNRPELRQMIVGAVLDGTGRPLCCELWPGNIADVTALMPVVERLKTRFGIASVCVVADRGMISAGTIAELEGGGAGISYILGVRMRKTVEVRDEVLPSDECFTEVVGPRRSAKDPSPLAVREQWIEGRRIEDESRYDGMWVLRTNTDLGAAEAALKYKQLWTVEDLFRPVKSVLATRPIFHKVDDTIRGHVFCSFLALVLLKELESRLEAHGRHYAWDDIKRDLNALEEVEVEVDGKPWFLRTDVRGACGAVLKAAGVAVPPTARS
jgi:hypothetical protein